MSGTKWQDRGEKKKQGRFTPILLGSQFYLLERKVPLTQGFKPLQVPATHGATAASLGLPRVRGVRTERREVGGGGRDGGWGFPTLSTLLLARIRGLLLEVLSGLTAPCWVVGYIAFRLGNTRGEKMVSLPMILKFLSSFQVSL